MSYKDEVFNSRLCIGTVRGRWVIPMVSAMGFGNNIFALTRAHLIAETCGMRFVWPKWPYCPHVRPRTRRGYGLYFPQTSGDRWRWFTTRLNALVAKRIPAWPWPVVVYSRQAYQEALRAGIEDEGDACRRLLQARGLDHPRKRVAVLVEPGDLSEYRGIRKGREWLARVMAAYPRTQCLLDRVTAATAGKFRVGIQIRMGDFVERGRVTVDGVPTRPGIVEQGERNVRLPLEWYLRIGEQLRRAVDCVFVLVSDGTPEELAPLLNRLKVVHFLGEPYQDLAGALVLARSDLVICSN